MNSALESVQKSPARGKLDDNIVQSASGVTLGARLIEGSLQQKIYGESFAVRVTVNQLISSLLSMADQLGSSRLHPTLIHLGGIIISFLESKDRLLDAVENGKLIFY